MSLLLDSQAFLWFVTQNPLLSARANALLESEPNPCFLSVASIWEIAIKISIGKLTVPQPFAAYIDEQLKLNVMEVLPIEIDDAATIISLPHHHRDPFDRIIVAQAFNRQMTLVSSDRQLDAYGVNRVW
ncbi:type II toxin-antitoxin system VapC family toxin [soil metagenome]